MVHVASIGLWRRWLLYTLALGLLCVCADAWAAKPKAGDWQVRRKGRRAAIQKQLWRILRRRPFAKRALSRLWRGASATTKKAWLATWKRRVSTHPTWKHQLLYARLLSKMNQPTRAAAQLLSLSRRTSFPARYANQLQWLLWRAQLRTGARKQAWRRFQVLWEKSPKRRRTRQKRRLYQMALALLQGGQVNVSPLHRWLRERRWSIQETRKLAEAMAAVRMQPQGLALMKQTASRLRGLEQLRMRLGLLRMCVRWRRLSEGQAVLQEIRKGRVLPRWGRRESLALEHSLYRATGRMSYLLTTLQRRWRMSRYVPHVALLAKLLEQAGWPESILWSRRVLSLQPSHREARLRLIRYLFKEERREEGFEHIAKLIEYNKAFPVHYVRLIKYQLQQSSRQRLSRWRPAWKRKWKALCRRPKPSHQRWQSCLLRPLCRASFQCEKKRWKGLREVVWTSWKKEALAKEKQAYTEAQRLMSLCMKRFPRDWGALYDIERLAEGYGAKKLAKASFRMLLAATTSNPAQVKATAKRLHRIQQERKILPLLRRALGQQKLPLSHALLLSSFAMSAGSLQRRFAKRPRVWKRIICSDIRRALRPFLKRSKAASLSLKQALRMGVSLASCGERSRSLSRWFEALEKRAKSQPVSRRMLFEAYTSARLVRPWLRLFGQRDGRAEIEEMHKWLQVLLEGAEYRSFKGYFRRLAQRMKQPWLAALSLHFACVSKVSCRRASWEASRVLRLCGKRKWLAPGLLKGLRLASTHHLFRGLRNRWLPRIFRRPAFRQQEGRAKLLGAYALFADVTRLRHLHLRFLMKLSTGSKKTPLRDVARWGQLLYQHQKMWSWRGRSRRVQRRICRRSAALVSVALQHWKAPWKANHNKALAPVGKVISKCLERRSLSVRFFKQLLQKLQTAPEQRIELLRFVLRYELQQALQLVLDQSSASWKKAKKPGGQVSSLLRSLSESEKLSFVGAFQRHCFKKLDTVSPLVHQVVASICQSKSPMCRQVFRCFLPMMHSKNTQPSLLLRLLQTTAKSGLQETQKYVDFVRRLIQYWKQPFLLEGWEQERNFPALHRLASMPALFQSKKEEFRFQLAKTHVSLLLYVFAQRQTMPVDAHDWARWLKRYDADGGYYFKQVNFVQEALKKQQPASRALAALRYWFTSRGQREVQQMLRQRKQSTLFWPGKPSLPLLMMLTPHYQSFTSKAGVEQQWRKWFTTHPKQVDHKAIHQWTKRCCLDLSSKRSAMRLLRFGLKKQGVTPLRKDLVRILRKLKANEREPLLSLVGGLRKAILKDVNRSSRWVITGIELGRP